MSLFAGIDIGGGSIKGILTDPKGNVMHETREPTDSQFSNDGFIAAVKKVAANLLAKGKAEAIGIGSPGPLDVDQGLVLHSTNLPNLKNTPLVKSIRDEFNIPVYLNNDANCAALGEYYFGGNTGVNSLVALTLGTGLGGGWVYQGKLFSGMNGNAMEAGHLTIVKDGALCGCGKKGCAESYFSAVGLMNRYFDKTGKKPDNVKELFDLCRDNNTDAREVLFFGADILAELIKNIIHLINPDKVVMVGGITASYDLFGPYVENRVKELVFPVFAEKVTVAMGNNVAGAYGAAALAIQEEK